MGVKTAEELITEGVRLAGREYDATDTRPLSDLIEWLSSVALGWPWPETIANFGATLAAGAYDLSIGGGGTIAAAYRVLRINFPIKIEYGSNILSDNVYQEGWIENRESAYIPDGLPDKASYTRNFGGVSGKAVIAFNKKPTTDIRLLINVQYDPAVDYTLASTPWYPNDLTIKESIAYYTAKHHDGVAAEKTLKLEDSLSIMVKNDKLKFGVIDSFVMKMNRNPRGR